MKIKMCGLLVTLLMLFSSAAYAMECDVEFRAKRTATEGTWYGNVEKPAFKTGVVSGEGATRKLCANDALSSLKQAGWQIRYQKIIKTY
ncbi:MAG: Unknown protein [uncultured Thiotrichaceae bacterium]|uniref:Uncharacterized protein n=1 Tax=uncultured Thiotrichaceae bacterium TaxID=298394 RepID=A0A6S6S7H6_9GAMM|nr:MAG: Unknown protein [uncultured Thiotrichaceae bacterium]